MNISKTLSERLLNNSSFGKLCGLTAIETLVSQDHPYITGGLLSPYKGLILAEP